MNRLGWILTLCLAAFWPSLLVGGEPEVLGPPLPRVEFREDCVFLGIAKKGEALIACYFRREEWSPQGLVIRAILVPTAQFPFEKGYRGFQKVNPYRVKRGEGLQLTFDGGVAAFSLRQHRDLPDTTPVPVEFLSSDRRADLLPDDIEKMELKVRGVSKWTRVPRKDLARWTRSFDESGTARDAGRRASAPGESAPKGETPGVDAGYKGRYATLNGTYLFEKKTVYSPIIAVLDAGEYLEYTKPAGEGWMEVLYGESNRKGYVLSVFLVDTEEDALRWEKEKDLVPIPPPLEPSSGTAEGHAGNAPEP